MKIKFLFLLLLPLLVSFCSKKKEAEQVVRPQGEFQVSRPSPSDREPNGGMLRLNLDGKVMHDKFFVAQFTPRGDIFERDNLQLFNYNLGSEKFPQLIINLDYKESDLRLWQGQTLPLDFLAFSAAADAPPLNSTGQLTIAKVTDREIEGSFRGDLVNSQTQKRIPIRGEFKAIIQVNI